MNDRCQAIKWSASKSALGRQLPVNRPVVNDGNQPRPDLQGGHTNDAYWSKVVISNADCLSGQVRHTFKLWPHGWTEWSAPNGNGGHEELARAVNCE